MAHTVGGTAGRLARWPVVLPWLGALLAGSGLLLLGWVAWRALDPGPAPYRYLQVETGGIEASAKLGLDAWPDLAVSKLEIRVEGLDQPVAVAEVARRGDASPVVLDWENRGGEPVVFVDTRRSEVLALATAIATHAPKEAVVLGWWDTSRQIRLLSGRETVFTAHLGEPLLAPAFWRDKHGRIEKYEREFWGAPGNAEERRSFQRFADALSADVAAGTSILRELAGGREAYVVVHVGDLYKLGLMRPDRLAVAYKDFPVQGDLHGPIGFVKRWMRDGNYTAYALHEIAQGRVRAYFLADAASGGTLLAQMLPLTTSTPLELQALHLVYQHGGYWVYRIPAAAPAGG